MGFLYIYILASQKGVVAFMFNELCEIDYASKPIQNFNNIGFGNQN